MVVCVVVFELLGEKLFFSTWDGELKILCLVLSSISNLAGGYISFDEEA